MIEEQIEKLKAAIELLKQNLDMYVSDAIENGNATIEENEWLAQLDDICQAAYGSDNFTIEDCME
jgi:hypothetical protein